MDIFNQTVSGGSCWGTPTPPLFSVVMGACWSGNPWECKKRRGDTEKEGKREVFCSLVQMPEHLKSSQKSRSPSGSYIWVTGTNVNHHLLPSRATNRKPDWKQSSLISNWHSKMGCKHPKRRLNSLHHSACFCFLFSFSIPNKFLWRHVTMIGDNLCKKKKKPLRGFLSELMPELEDAVWNTKMFLIVPFWCTDGRSSGDCSLISSPFMTQITYIICAC